MDNYKDLTEVYRRASLASVVKLEEPQDKLKNEKLKPKDTFYLVYALCFFLGLVNILPLTFFITANSYWMYKFRDTATDIVDLNNKTTLQTYFTSGIIVVQTVPSIVFMLLFASIGHRYRVHLRITVTLISQIVIFVIFTIFIEVNTDSWQLGFFIMTLLAIAVLTGFLNLFQLSSFAVVPKFPIEYTKVFLLGQGVASFFSALLQVISLAIGTSVKASAMLYFVLGTSMICITLILYFISQYLQFYQHYMHVVLGDVKKAHSKAEVKSVLLKIWPVLAMNAFLFLTLFLTHPCITSLVVSEYYGNGNEWNEVYFVPVITFLLAETISLIGRAVARPIVTKTNGPWMVALTIIRMFILVPLIMLCNAQPRSHLPVVFTHDWQYILLCIVYFTTSGFLLSAVYLSIPRFAPGEEDVAFMIMMTATGISLGVLSSLLLVYWLFEYCDLKKLEILRLCKNVIPKNFSCIQKN